MLPKELLWHVPVPVILTVTAWRPYFREKKGNVPAAPKAASHSTSLKMHLFFMHLMRMFQAPETITLHIDEVGRIYVYIDVMAFLNSAE